MPYRFPRAKFVETMTVQEQVSSIAKEYGEVLDEFARPPVNYDNVAIELFDLIHRCETALRILQEKNKVDVNGAREFVVQKNRIRGYY